MNTHENVFASLPYSHWTRGREAQACNGGVSNTNRNVIGYRCPLRILLIHFTDFELGCIYM